MCMFYLMIIPWAPNFQCYWSEVWLWINDLVIKNREGSSSNLTTDQYLSPEGTQGLKNSYSLPSCRILVISPSLTSLLVSMSLFRLFERSHLHLSASLTTNTNLPVWLEQGDHCERARSTASVLLSHRQILIKSQVVMETVMLESNKLQVRNKYIWFGGGNWIGLYHHTAI